MVCTQELLRPYVCSKSKAEEIAENGLRHIGLDIATQDDGSSRIMDTAVPEERQRYEAALVRRLLHHYLHDAGITQSLPGWLAAMTAWSTMLRPVCEDVDQAAGKRQ